MSKVELFFISYFLGLAILYIVFDIRDRLKASNLKKSDWQTFLAKDVLHFCLNYYPINKKSPSLKLVSVKSNLSGQYCFSTNSIILYRLNNMYKAELINTVIHEYFHFYLITSNSKYNLYQDQLKKYNYVDHPQEIICNTMSKKLTNLYLSKQN